MRRLKALVSPCLKEDIRDTGLNVLSSGERAYVALSAKRYDLLVDPVEAWHQLDRTWQLAVCEWRGWPTDWCCQEGEYDFLLKAFESHRRGTGHSSPIHNAPRDINGTPIMPFDVVKIYHFTDATTQRRHYMYKHAQTKEVRNNAAFIRIGHLDESGDSYLLAADGLQHSDYEVVQHGSEHTRHTERSEQK